MTRLIGLILGVLLVGGGFFIYAKKGDALKQTWDSMTDGYESHYDVVSDAVTPEKGIPEQMPPLEIPVVEKASEAPQVSLALNLPLELPVGMPETDTDVSSDVHDPDKTVEYRQIFWRPFRTRISAGGFADRVQEITGLTIEVMEQAPAEFVVAFPYADENERKRGLELIMERTRMVVRVDGSEG